MQPLLSQLVSRGESTVPPPRRARWLCAMVCALAATACDSSGSEARAPTPASNPPAARAEQGPATGDATATAAAAESGGDGATGAGKPGSAAAAEPGSQVAAAAGKGAAAASDTPTQKQVDKAPTEVAAATGGDSSAADTDAKVAAVPLTRVLLLGDSMIATGFGVKLESLLDHTPGVVAYRKGKSASGLARPDFYDWMAEGRHQALEREPDVVVVMLGGNDGQDLTTNGPSKRRVRWGSEAWNDAYAARVDRLLARVWAPGRTIVWLGLPRMDLRSLEKKLELIRGIQKRRVQAHPGGIYLETTPFLLNTEGELRVHGTVRGKRRVLRADDGIHFTMAGSAFLAQAVVGPVLEAFGYEPPESDEPAASAEVSAGTAPGVEAGSGGDVAAGG